MRLVLCDENRILSEALAAALEMRGHQVVAIAATPDAGLAAVATYQPDAILLDLCFPGGTPDPGADASDGLRAARSMRQRFPGTAVLVLSSLVDPETWSAAAKIGVAGFLGKDKGVCELARVLDVVAAGGVVLDPRRGNRAGRRPSQRRCSYPPYVLTPREKEVLRRIVAGQSTTQMADEMDITIGTLRSYVKSILTKLGAHSRLEAAAVAIRGDLLGDLSA